MGAGIRLKFIDSKVFNGYFGNSYMYEIEKVDILDETYYRHRHNSYLSLTFNLKNKDDKPVLELTNTTYFQPLYSLNITLRLLLIVLVQLLTFYMVQLSNWEGGPPVCAGRKIMHDSYLTWKLT